MTIGKTLFFFPCIEVRAVHLTTLGGAATDKMYVMKKGNRMKSTYQRRSSRRSMLKGVAAGTAGVAAVAGLAVGGFVLEENKKSGDARAANYDDRSYRDNDNSIKAILNIAITAEHLAVTFYTNALRNANRLGFNDIARMDLKAALIEEQVHLNFLFV
jgi:hypothetical protein